MPWPDERKVAAQFGSPAVEALRSLGHALFRGTEPPPLAEALGTIEATWPLRLQNDGPWKPDGVLPRYPASLELLTKVALDMAPAAGDDGPLLALGPMGLALDPSDPLQRRAWMAAVASVTFTIPAETQRTPFKSWLRDPHPPEGDIRRAGMAVARTPWLVWRLCEAPDGWHLEPLLPLSPAWLPSEPVQLDEVGGLDGPPRDGGLLIARVVRTQVGWRAVPGFVLPVCPEPALLRAWFAEIAVPQVFAQPSFTQEDVLRRAGHLLVARAHRWWWAHRSAA